MKRAFIVIAIISLAAIYSIFFVSSRTHGLTLTPDGFIPQILNIHQGDTVVFQTTSGKFYWPASDPHPLHNTYNMFDSKKAIAPDKSWSFRFERIGSWHYHDHLSPIFNGTIVVEPSLPAGLGVFHVPWAYEIIARYKNFESIDSIIKRCKNKDNALLINEPCWKEVFVNLVKTRGVDDTLRFLDRVRRADLTFATECHVLAHTIGEASYERLARGALGNISEDRSVCNYGFYHGLMQEFVSHGKGLALAKQFCLSQATPGISQKNDPNVHQCFHGIGHGLVFWYAANGKPDEPSITAWARGQCLAALGQYSYTMHYQCINGIYGGIAALYFTLHGFTYTMRPSDPFWFCRSEPSVYQKLCFDELVPPVFSMTTYDLVASGKFIQTIADEESRLMAMEHLGWMPSHRGLIEKGNYSDVVLACQQFGGELGSFCLRGVAKSFVATGKMSDAIKRAVQFCRTSELLSDQEAFCKNAIIEQIQFSYDGKDPKDKCTYLAQVSGLRCE